MVRFNLDSWFESYDKGRTFVTNGPLLDFTINGKGIGEELRVKRGTKLDVAADGAAQSAAKDLRVRSISFAS